MLGHNCETAHNTDLDTAGGTGVIIQQTEQIIGRIRLGAAYAANAQGIQRTTEIILITPWASAGGFGAVNQATSTARAKALAQRYTDIAQRLGVGHLNLAAKFGYTDPLAALHPGDLTELALVTRGIDQGIRNIPPSDGLRIRNRAA